jgi:hypothetical protein
LPEKSITLSLRKLSIIDSVSAKRALRKMSEMVFA